MTARTTATTRMRGEMITDAVTARAHTRKSGLFSRCESDYAPNSPAIVRLCAVCEMRYAVKCENAYTLRFLRVS